MPSVLPSASPTAPTEPEVAAPSDAPGALVRVRSEEEASYARVLAAVETRRRRAADLRGELEELKLALGRFEAEYHARVGARFVELDRVRLAVDEYGRRLARLRGQLTVDLGDLERDVAEEFGDRRRAIDEEEAEAGRYQRAHAREADRPDLSAAEETELRRAYRELARRYHPDLARTEADRDRRTETMLRVNAAFRERDLPALRVLLRAGEVDDPAFEARPVAEKLAWAERERARLDGVVAGLVDDLDAVRASPTHTLWRRQTDDGTLLDSLVADLDREIAVARARLDDLVGAYQRLLAQRRAA